MSEYIPLLAVLTLVLWLIIGWHVGWQMHGKGKSRAVPDHNKYIKFAKGTQVICPNCKDLIATVNKDIYRCSQRNSSDLNWHQPHELCDSAECKVCKAWYIRESSNFSEMYTQFGWRDQVTAQDLLTATGEQQ